MVVKDESPFHTVSLSSAGPYNRWLVVYFLTAVSTYLASDGFSLTDIYLAVVSRWAQQEHWLRDPSPRPRWNA